MQAPVRRLLPASVNYNCAKPANIIDKMNQEFDEIENVAITQISTASSTKKGTKVNNSENIAKSNTPLTKTVQETRLRASRHTSPSSSVLEKSKNEKIKVYEDKCGNYSNESADSVLHGPSLKSSIPKTRGNSKRNTGKSAIPVPTTTYSSTRMTRSKRT